jgi:excisionase family DNA binding protein
LRVDHLHPTTRKKEPDVSRSEEPLVFTVEEAAALLRISRGLAFAAVRSGSIPHIRIGRRILVPRGALLKLVHEDTAEPSVGVGQP